MLPTLHLIVVGVVELPVNGTSPRKMINSSTDTAISYVGRVTRSEKRILRILPIQAGDKILHNKLGYDSEVPLFIPIVQT